uniref:Uncharacterized protein n=1 Tax=Cyclophora tenuis TaxID=216820 RepID=A0A7S1GL09_CYCTE
MLMRIWTPAPFVGTQLAKFSRTYFFWAAILICGVVSSYTWAQFPYDNVCKPPNAETGFEGAYPVTFNDGTTGDVTVFQTESYRFCDQSWRGYTGLRFPATSAQQGTLKWMTRSQASLTDYYGWFSVALLTLVLLGVFGGSLLVFLRSFIQGTYEPDGKDAHINFHNVAEISAYVPQFKIGAFQYPVLACDVDDFVKTWIGWTDPAAPSYDQHNLIFDVPTEGMRDKTQRGEDLAETVEDEIERSILERRPIYSIVKSWAIQSESRAFNSA